MEPKIALIINSCEAFHQRTLPQFFAHAKQTGIPFDQIYVVVGESNHENSNQIIKVPIEEKAVEIWEQGGYNIIYSPTVNIDYNAAIFFATVETGRAELAQKYTHFFYIHDTADLLGHFWHKIGQHAVTCTKYIKLTKTHTKNIGLFNVAWFLANKTDFLRNIVNFNPDLKMAYKCGEYPNKEWLYHTFPCLCPWNLGEDCLFDYDEVTGEPTGDYFHNEVKVFFAEFYGSKDTRRVSIYDEPGVVKYQKNWGQPGATWDTNL